MQTIQKQTFVVTIGIVSALVILGFSGHLYLEYQAADTTQQSAATEFCGEFCGIEGKDQRPMPRPEAFDADMHPVQFDETLRCGEEPVCDLTPAAEADDQLLILPDVNTDRTVIQALDDQSVDA